MTPAQRVDEASLINGGYPLGISVAPRHGVMHASGLPTRGTRGRDQHPTEVSNSRANFTVQVQYTTIQYSTCCTVRYRDLYISLRQQGRYKAGTMQVQYRYSKVQVQVQVQFSTVYYGYIIYIYIYILQCCTDSAIITVNSGFTALPSVSYSTLTLYLYSTCT